MSSVGKILISVAAIAAVIALNYFAPGIGTYLSAQLGVTVSAFAVAAIGSVVISVGFALLTAALFKPGAPKIGQSKYNVRISDPPRFICGGMAAQGGGVVFAEFDGAGNLWYVIVHSDSILSERISYYLDNIPVEVSANGSVLTDEFCLTFKREPYAGKGAKVPYFFIWTRTYTETNPVPPPVADFVNAFPGLWTEQHMLVGTTYSVVCVKSIKIADRYKVYRWRGPIGMGEPSLMIAGVWSKMYDPRDPSQVLGNRATYKQSRNAAIVWAWFRTHPFGRNKPEASINWDRIAEQANICDQLVVGIETTQPRYQCGTSIIDNKDRATAEQEIMLSCDGQIVFDDNGRTWLRVGHYDVPSLKLTRNRDIIAMESVEATNGESETQGVIVEYLDPASGFSAQSSAPWYNPNYYEAGQGNTFLNVSIQTCTNHNQAMRLAKAIGMRSQPIHKIAPTVGLRGLKAMQERFVEIAYDNTFAGDYEICTPVEVDESGYFATIGLVPIDPDRFDLLPGEEKPKPVTASDGSVAPPIALPQGVQTFYRNSRIEVTFNQPARDDVTFEFQYIATNDIPTENWLSMTTNTYEGLAYSDTLPAGVSYSVRYRSLKPSGEPNDWSNPVSVGPTPTTIDPPTMLTVVGGAGSADVSWRNPYSANFRYINIARGTTNVLANATTIESGMVGGLGQVQQVSDTVPAGTYYYWILAYGTNGSTSQIGPVSGVVS